MKIQFLILLLPLIMMKEAHSIARVRFNQSQQSYTISAKLIFYGTEANDLLASKITTKINQYWNIDPKIKFEISYQLMETNKALEEVKWAIDPEENYIRIEKGNVYNVSFFNSNSGFFVLKDDLAHSTTAVHEFGHALGLPHPSQTDLRGGGNPGMMAPRGSLVDRPFSRKGTNTIDVYKRVVIPRDLQLLKLEQLKYTDGESYLETLDNHGYDVNGKEI